MPGPRFTPKRIRRSIKLDRVQAADLLAYDFRFACEDCSHFDSEGESCTIGYPSAPHRKKQQLALFNRVGHMAFCRFMEVD